MFCVSRPHALCGKLRSYILDPKDALPTRSTQSLQWRGVACDDGVPMHRIVFGCNRQGVTTDFPHAFSQQRGVGIKRVAAIKCI